MKNRHIIEQIKSLELTLKALGNTKAFLEAQLDPKGFDNFTVFDYVIQHTNIKLHNQWTINLLKKYSAPKSLTPQGAVKIFDIILAQTTPSDLEVPKNFPIMSVAAKDQFLVEMLAFVLTQIKLVQSKIRRQL